MGAPPRVREKPTVILTDDQALRSTPACAGKTKALKSPLYYTQDHPRVCGKNHGFYFNGQKQMGSIPRLREKHNHSKGHFLRPRITLACAGKTVEQSNPIGFYQDHPRVCGKNVRIAALETSCVGSPPLLREKPRFLFQRSEANGINPTSAGKTQPFKRSFS